MLQYFAGYFRALPCVVVAIQRNSMSHFKNSKKHVAIQKETLSFERLDSKKIKLSSRRGGRGWLMQVT